MQIFLNLILTMIVAMAVEKYQTKYLLVDIDDEGPKGKCLLLCLIHHKDKLVRSRILENNIS